MSFLRTVAGRVPVFFVGFGIVLITGTYKGNEGGFQTMPAVGALLVLVGLAIGGWLFVAR